MRRWRADIRYRILALSLLTAAAPPLPLDQPPAAIARYIDQGQFAPGDYHWLRGDFAGASQAEKDDQAAIVAWRQRCRAHDLARARADLAGMGIVAGPSLESIPYRSLVCNQIASLPEPLNLQDWAGFTRDVATVQPVAQGFLAAVALAEQATARPHAALRDALIARSTVDQLLRRGLDWANGAPSGLPPLTLIPQQRGILVSQIAIAMATRDDANTEWLKGVVASQGWPTRAIVGDAAADAAWLLVQHGDADPAFQLRSLRLMEPLVAAGQVNRRNFAYLYDRVMLKIAGKQRYGTQLVCRGGRYVPQPLEEARSVDAARRTVGLGTIAAHAAEANDGAAPCVEIPMG
jgi:hypothetical protein